MGLTHRKMILPAALVLCQAVAHASAPSSPMEGLAEEFKATPAPAADTTETTETLAQRLGRLSAGHLKAMAADTERRMAGYGTDTGLLGAGIFYANDYALALKAKGQAKRFEFMVKHGHFYHGLAPRDSFAQRGNPASPTGKAPVTFQLVPGVTPSAALASLRAGLSFLDCGSVVQIAHYEALREVLGQDKFDAVFAAESSTPLAICPDLAADLGLTCLFQSVAPGAPLQRGQLVVFSGVPNYHVKHINGEAANFNVLCDDASTPGQERFVGLGLSGHGTDLAGIEQVFVDAYNADPIGWDIFSPQLTANIRKTISVQFLTTSEAMASHRITLGELQKMVGTRIVQRCAFNAWRVAALVAASKDEARAQLAVWREAFVKEVKSRRS